MALNRISNIIQSSALLQVKSRETPIVVAKCYITLALELYIHVYSYILKCACIYYVVILHS